MQIELSQAEVSLLRTSLNRLVDETERELVRTDKADLQHALNRDLRTLTNIRDRLIAASERETPAHAPR